MYTAQCLGCRQIIVTVWKTTCLQHHQHLPALQHPFGLLFQDAKLLLYYMTHILLVSNPLDIQRHSVGVVSIFHMAFAGNRGSILCLDTQ